MPKGFRMAKPYAPPVEKKKRPNPVKEYLQALKQEEEWAKCRALGDLNRVRIKMGILAPDGVTHTKSIPIAHLRALVGPTAHNRSRAATPSP